MVDWLALTTQGNVRGRLLLKIRLKLALNQFSRIVAEEREGQVRCEERYRRLGRSGHPAITYDSAVPGLLAIVCMLFPRLPPSGRQWANREATGTCAVFRACSLRLSFCCSFAEVGKASIVRELQ